MRLEEAIDHLEEMLADENHEWTCEECRNEHEQLLGWLKELKGLRLENERWIPVSERYPEEEENYLVTIKFGDMNIIQVARFSCDLTTVDPVGVDMQGEEYKRPGFWIHESEYGFSSLNVIAWKNLPIAYKGEDGKWVRP